MNDNLRYFRKSHIILIGDIILLELFMIFIYLILRVPQSFFGSYLEVAFESALNIISVFYFIIISLTEIVAVLFITLRWANEEYEIRDGSVIHKRGIFSITEETYSLRSLGNTTISQGLVGKLFNYGTIKLYSPLLKKEFFMTNVHDPRHIAKALEDDISGENESGTVIRRS